jgi:GLPGLI family protein
MKLQNIPSLSFLLFVATGFGQNTTKITFASKPHIQIEHLKDLAEEIQEITLQQLKKTIFIETMRIDETYVYFETKPQVKEETKEGDLASKLANGKMQTTKQITTTMNSPVNKYRKNAKENNYAEKIDGHLATKDLPSVSWVIGTNTKKILGYVCLSAVGKYDNKIIKIYFTKELSYKASPELIPFIDGVVLEYDNGFMSGIATKIEKNQPDVKDFFKN